MSALKLPRWILGFTALLHFVLSGPAAVGQAPAAESTKVVPIIVVDSDDDAIGKAVTKDGQLVKQGLEDGFKGKDRLAKPVIVNHKITPDGILKAIDELQVGEKDTLFFFYSGHGAWNKDRGQYLQLYSGPGEKQGELFRATLVEKLKAKNARLVVLITNCCNKEYPLRGPVTRDLANPPQFETLRRLLLQPAGFVDITSSAQGELSWVWWPDANGNEQGCIFTVALVGLFRHELKPTERLDWKIAVSTLKQWTQDDFEKYRNEAFQYYKEAPEQVKKELALALKDLLDQPRQTVYSYSLDIR